MNGCNFMVLGAITMKFGVMKHKKMLSSQSSEKFLISFTSSASIFKT